MRRKFVVFILALLVVLGVIVGFYSVRQRTNGVSERKKQTTNRQANDEKKVSVNKKVKNKKILIVYFSRKDGVYGGHLKVGNTKRVADFIKDKTGGDEYEIIPAKEYPKSYKKTTEVAQREQDENARPKLKNKLPDVNNYDTIFIGSPIWWSEYPMVVRTFLDGVDLNNKNVIPFTTHEGSGLGNTPEVLKREYKNAKVLKGFSVEGNKAKNAKNDVDKWLDGLGY